MSSSFFGCKKRELLRKEKHFRWASAFIGDVSTMWLACEGQCEEPFKINGDIVGDVGRNVMLWAHELIEELEDCVVHQITYLETFPTTIVFFA